MQIKSKIKYGVIPAAGGGTRMGYLSNLLPKCLFPVYDRPILHHIINQMEKIGVEEIFIIIKTHKQKVIEYIDSVKADFRAKISLIEQKEIGSIGDAILTVEKYINEPFMVILGDDCTITDSFKPMLEEFFRKKPVVMEVMVKEKDKNVLKNTCCAKLDKQGKILEILEKPEVPPYKLRGCGVYMFDPKIFSYIKKVLKGSPEKRLGITEAINLAAQKGLAYGHIIKGENININDYNDLIKANLLFKKL